MGTRAPPAVACPGVPVGLLLLQHHRAASAELLAVVKRSPGRRCANKKSARWALRDIARQKKQRQRRRPGPCFNLRKDKAPIRGIVEPRRIVSETRCPS